MNQKEDAAYVGGIGIECREEFLTMWGGGSV